MADIPYLFFINMRRVQPTDVDLERRPAKCSPPGLLIKGPLEVFIDKGNQFGMFRNQFAKVKILPGVCGSESEPFPSFMYLSCIDGPFKVSDGIANLVVRIP